MSLLRQGLSYGIVGGLQLLADWGCFVVLTMLGIPTAPANVLGRILGAAIGFWLNGKATFSSALGEGLGWRHLRRFLVSWGLMTVMSTIAIEFANQAKGLQFAWVVKPLADALLALAGFAVSKFWIYR
ncbi:hypothetical protein BKK81_16015 [Cupriavidus sp. USMAHM13]|uniref:GtrA family protein n=1 Tax=Cupriavidus sp. USMAHM13 TaxID=1389192 RepID=UPI0008A67DA4|nr:GtrA family protein [Cupriavidus sp. USMAHM13]AOZ00578.1 hypothetical protein BKK81_16015 [Cupriavidus sp. USMAHM13]